MTEILHIHGDQCGNQIGAKFWEVICDGTVLTTPANTSATLPSSSNVLMSTSTNSRCFEEGS
uniref:Tubulin/FtsZ GTPase domain-containing protein n=1 Tax=Brassica campestris TaxID=3711 RepID=M4E9P2_BRACM